MTKLDKTGKEITLPVEAIPQTYHTNEQEFIAPPIRGYQGDVATRHSYSEAEMTSISQDIREGTKGSGKSSKKLA
jgi:hypothetical protein